MRKSTWPLIGILAVAILLAGGLLFFGTNPANQPSRTIPGVGGGPDERVNVTDILQSPNEYVAQTVTLEGEIERTLSTRMFVLDQKGTIVGDEILVITENPVPQEAEGATVNPFNEADQVTVTGTVNRLLIEEIERDLAIDLDQQTKDEFANRPVITASDVTVRLSD